MKEYSIKIKIERIEKATLHIVEEGLKFDET
jgi:hypothetical protein